jgi:2-polyprenyl-6-methoxyphenol hydroxylase-like FAD-dependent oxidoreductase
MGIKRALIVGAGPVGLTCGHLLSKIGVQTTLIERSKSISSHPKAQLVHSRTMEVMRDIGLADEIYRLEPPLDEWRKHVYCNTVTGKQYGSYDHFSGPRYEKTRLYSDLMHANFYQSQLCNLLYDHRPSSLDVRLGENVTSLTQDENSVVVTTADGKKYEGDYLVACDGAGSTVRKLLNIDMTPATLEDNILSIHFSSPTLANILSKNPAMLYFVSNPQLIGVLCFISLKESEFVMQIAIAPPFESLETFTESDFRSMILKAAGTDDINKDLKIMARGMWKVKDGIATKWQKGRVFLAGDAARRIPPSAAYGLNTGIQDVNNLYWKLGYPMHHESYYIERLHRAKHIIDLSNQNHMRIRGIFKQFNMDINMMNKFRLFCAKVPFGKQVFMAGKKAVKYIFKDDGVEKYLSNPENLMLVLYPEDELRLHYTSGFLEPSAGGMLAPNIQVSYNDLQYPLRKLPGVLIQERKKPVMLYVEGENKLSIPEVDLEIVKVKSPNSHSYLLRPDSVLYSSTEVEKVVSYVK